MLEPKPKKSAKEIIDEIRRRSDQSANGTPFPPLRIVRRPWPNLQGANWEAAGFYSATANGLNQRKLFEPFVESVMRDYDLA